MSGEPLALGPWALCSTAPGAASCPKEVDSVDWITAPVPGTVAQALNLPLDHRPTGNPAHDLDGRDWWYRTRLPALPEGVRHHLRFDGLATLAEIWINGVSVLQSTNQFLPAVVPLDPALLRADGDTNALWICFRSLTEHLKARRPRPRWKTALVDEQKLRWVRTGLLGRIPGWTPALPAVGPWRAVVVEPVPSMVATDIRIEATAVDGVATLTLSCALPEDVDSCAVTVGENTLPMSIVNNHASVKAALPGVPLWWPQGAGEAHCEPAVIRLLSGGATVDQPLPALGFRSIAAITDGGQFTLIVNGQRLFCRGACWTVEDARSMDGAPGDTARSVAGAAASGLNMLRIGGTMTWASDELLKSCDQHGILIWHDLMFANMDLPMDDPAFAASITHELDANLRRLAGHPCVAVVCGGSEVLQQASMLGLGTDAPAALHREAEAQTARHLPGTAWVDNSPSGGVLPFHTGHGITHYYGVGAYQRPLSDARRARVRFTPECLGFSNVPADETLALLPRGADTPPHHPDWKAAVPRDNGAGWDFEDVRDHYLTALFGLDPVQLRRVDPGRYRTLSRLVTGEVMLRTFAEWRRPDSGCDGALVWFLKDLRPGAGWGILDSARRPKSAWWFLKRAWAPRAILLTDEGLDGVGVHVLNETPTPWSGEVELLLCDSLRGVVRSTHHALSLAPFSGTTLSGDALLDGFVDACHAYRFGPPTHDCVVARMLQDDVLISEDVLFPGGHALPMLAPTEVEATASTQPDGTVQVDLSSTRLIQGLHVESPGYTPDDDWFHLSPGRPRTLVLRPGPTPPRRFKAWVHGCNLDGSITLRT